MSEKKEEKIARILGFGFDNKDGHFRLTEGQDFKLLDGSEATHEQMQEICLKITTKLESMGLRLEDLTKEEFINLVSDLD